MKPAVRDTLTGILAIAGTAGLVVMLIVFGELANVGKTFYDFGIRMPSARGLTPTSVVTLNGVRVGEITDLSTAEDPRDGVIVTIRVQDTVVVPDDFGVFLEQGLIAGSSMDLVVPPESSGSPIVTGNVYEPEISSLFGDLSNELDNRLAKFNDAADKISKLADTYTELGRTIEDGVREQLAARTAADVDAGATPNLMSAIDRLDAAGKLVTEFGGELTGEGGLRDQLVTQLANAADLIAEIRETAASFRAAADEATEGLAGVGDAVDNLNVAALRVGDAAEEARVALGAINAGEGTLGQLAQNPDLYNNLRAATDRLQSVLGEAELVLARIREDGVKIGF